MKRNIIAVIALILLSGVGAQAQTERRPMQHDMSKMDMSSMMKEPHHALAMAYMQNMSTFAKALNKQAALSGPLDSKFARSAVAEIRRSLDQMEEHHAEHMKTMSAEMRTNMAGMMKDMEKHRAMLKDAVVALEKDVLAEPLDSKQVASDSAALVKHLEGMSKMRHDGMKMKM